MKAKDTSHINWHEVFYYDESSPTGLRRVKDWTTGRNQCILRARAGDVAGNVKACGYARVWYQGKIYVCHRIIQELHGDDLTGLTVDHIDGNKLNNLRSNLRNITHAQNLRNMSRRKDTKEATGVRSRNGGKVWVATWNELDGSHGYRSFSVSKYGEAVAKLLAVRAREDAIARLNTEGAGYTTRHGEN